MSSLVKTDAALEVSLQGSGGRFEDELAKIKEVPGSRFDKKSKLWLVPLDPKAAERIIHAMEPDYDPAIMEWIKAEAAAGEQDLVTELPEDDDELEIEWAYKHMNWQPLEVNGEPFIGLKAHQRSVVGAVADDEEVRAVIADDMGLGKSASAIAIIAESVAKRETPLVGPKLIVCPNSVKGTWKREIHRWLGPDEPVVIADGTTPTKRDEQVKEAIADNAWLIINYEQLRITKVTKKLKNGGKKTVKAMKQPLFETTEWIAVVADECHRAKNRKALQTQGLFKVKAPIMLALSGTPLMNSPDDLWAILHWLFPTEYKSFWGFYNSYVDYIEGHYGKEIIGVKNPDALRFELYKRMYRRTKGQVLDLPEKQRIIIPVDLDAKTLKVYNEAEGGLWVELEKKVQEGDKEAKEFVERAVETTLFSIPNGAARTVRLRQILSNLALLEGDDHSCKMEAISERVFDNSNHQHVVFSEFVESCSLLAARLEAGGVSAQTYTGQIDQRDRSKIEDKFQKGSIDVLVGTIGAMREGITLAAADIEHFLERAWVPAWNEQAEDRCHRIGQRNPVTIYIYEAVDTVDDGTVKVTNSLKRAIVKTVLPTDHVKET